MKYYIIYYKMKTIIVSSAVLALTAKAVRLPVYVKEANVYLQIECLKTHQSSILLILIPNYFHSKIKY